MSSALDMPLFVLEQEFRRRDPYGSGVVSRSEFTFVLVRHGGMLTQIDALADNFACGDASLLGAHSTVDYRRFIEHMRSLVAPVEVLSPTRVIDLPLNSSNEIARSSEIVRDVINMDATVVQESKCADPRVELGDTDTVSLRFVFKQIACDAHKVPLRTICEGMQKVGLSDVSLPSLEALCDAIFEDEFAVANRTLGVEEFCTLVSRLPPSTIRFLRSLSTWKCINPTRVLNFDPIESNLETSIDASLKVSERIDEILPSIVTSALTPLASNVTSSKSNSLSVALRRFQQPTASSQRKGHSVLERANFSDAHKVRKTTKKPSSRSSSPKIPIEAVNLVSREDPKQSNRHFYDPHSERGPSTPLKVAMSVNRKLLLEYLGPKCNILMGLCSDLDKGERGVIRFDSLCALVLALAQGSQPAVSRDVVESTLLPYRRMETEWVDYSQFVGDIIITVTPQNIKKAPSSQHVERDSPTLLTLTRSKSPSIDFPSSNASLEERVRAGQEKIQRLLKNELLDCCSYDGKLLVDTLVANSVAPWHVAEKQLRKNFDFLYQKSKRTLPLWVVDRSVKIARIPFEGSDTKSEALCDVRHLLTMLHVIS
ncbi:Hypothetical protein, putative [Bodo saltans]|uniref:EF-hand domain-containing protein n=1 Tax=Bodo saltans TaxID=75058 RepID=A0A0S4JS49_BODSA|nr:Hypothetical protein, putative [Bodo saltans]|eukprot:CUG94315.1 Hypothetical protein, putative [Bodo saltans]